MLLIIPELDYNPNIPRRAGGNCLLFVEVPLRLTMPRAAAICCVLFLLALPRATIAEDMSLSTRLMLCTFRLTNGATNASAFVLTRENDQQPRLLITAAHAFQQMSADQATLVGRKRTPEGGFEKLNVVLQIRKEGKPLWTRHPEADVAVIEVSLPPEVEVARLPLDILANDELLKKYEVQPGDFLRCIGYPHANQFEANAAGFPVVRLGCIASYPLLPTKATKTFFMDYNAFEGDSGGAVYLDDASRIVDGKLQEGRTQLIMGLVHGQQIIQENFQTIYQSGQSRHRMGLGIIVHASAIRETIDLLEKKP